MATAVIPADLLCALRSLNLRGRTSSWELKNDGHRISLNVEWSDSMRSVGFRPNTTSLPCSSIFGLQRKAPSTLRRDQERMEEYVRKKTEMPPSETENTGSEKRCVENGEILTSEKVSVSVQTEKFNGHIYDAETQTDGPCTKTSESKETQTFKIDKIDIGVTTEPARLSMTSITESKPAAKASGSGLQQKAGPQKPTRNENTPANIPTQKAIDLIKPGNNRKTQQRYIKKIVAIVPDNETTYYLVKWSDDADQTPPHWLQEHDLDEAGRKYIKQYPEKILYKQAADDVNDFVHRMLLYV